MSSSTRRSFATAALLISALHTIPSFAQTDFAAAQPTLTATPASLSFGTWQIGTAPLAAVTVGITSTNPATGLAVTGNRGNCGWLSLSGISGSTPYKASVSVNIAGLIAGDYSCSMSFTASGASPISVTASLTVLPAPAKLTLTCSPATGPVQVGTAYSASCTASGGIAPYHWSSTGKLPAGLTLSAASGTPVTIGGTPTTADAYNYQVHLTDSGVPAQNAAPQTYTGSILPPAPTVTSISPTSGVAGSTMPVTLTGNNFIVGNTTVGVGSASITVGSVKVVSATRVTATFAIAASATPGSADVAVTTSGGTSSAVSFTVNRADPPLTFSCTPSTGPTTVGAAYSASCTASGGTSPYHWSTGTLPAGLTLSATTGSTVTVGGTPTAAAAYNYQVQLTDSGMPAQRGTAQIYSGTIQPAAATLSFTCTPSTGPTQVGTAYSASCTASGGTAPYKWSTGTLPAGLTLSAITGTTVTIGGTPTAAGAYNYQVQLTDSGTTPQSAPAQTYSGNIAPAPTTLTFTCTPASGPTTVGTAYSASCTASGGTAPYKWSTGTLLAGLTLSATTGTTVTIGGTPTAAGAYNYQVQLTDSGTPSAQSAPAQTYSGNIVPAPATLTFTCTLATGPTQVGTAYSASCTASGGTAPYHWSTGTLPAGLTLSAATGTTVTIGGTPTAAGEYNYLVQLTDSGMPSAQSAMAQTYSGTIQPAPATLTFTCTPATGPVQVGTAYSASCTASGGTAPYHWSTGTLPAGVTLSANTGTTVTIGGTPTAAGEYNYQIQLTDSGMPSAQSAMAQTYSGTIAPAPATLTFTCTPSTGPTTVGTAYSASCTASGGTAPYKWSTGTLPAGVTLSANTGTTVTIGGTPTAAGAYNYQVQLTDSGTPTAQTAPAQTYSGNIQPAPATLTFTCTPATGPAAVGTAYSATCKASGGTAPYTWSTGTLPAGLTLSATTGTPVTIAGTPTAAGAYNYQVQLTDSGTPSAQTAPAQTYSGSVLPPAPVLTCTPATGPVQVGAAYSSTCSVTGGTTPYSFSISDGTLPAGLTLDSTSGAIGGTPTTGGAFSYTISVKDGGTPAQSATQSYSGKIRSPIMVDPSSLSFTYRIGDIGGPASQSLSVFSTPPGTAFSASVSAGGWLTVAVPPNSVTPGTFPVSINTSGITAAGTLLGSVTITPASGNPVNVPVSFTVLPKALPPQLSALPLTENLALNQGSAATGGQITVSNTGSGTVQFTAASDQSWLSAGAGGSATFTAPGLLGFTVNPGSLNPGLYTGHITITGDGPSGKATVTVTLAVSTMASSMQLSQSGMNFTTSAGGSSPPAQSFTLSNAGGGTINWAAQAQTIRGGTWLNVTPAGVSIGGQTGGAATVSVIPDGLAEGQYYGVVDIRAPGAVNSPQNVSVLLTVQKAGTKGAGIVFSTGGLTLGGTAGIGTATGQVSLFNPSNAAGTFATTTSVSQGSVWLSVSPPSGTLAPGPNQLTVQANLAGLGSGVYNGVVTVAFDDGTTGEIQVALVATGSGSAAPQALETTESEALQPRATQACAGNKPGYLIPNFRQPLSQTSAQVAVVQLVQVQIVDDCNHAVTQSNGGGAEVTFSNKDDAVKLSDTGGGIWEGTWTPSHAAAQVTLQVVAKSAGSGLGDLLGGTTLTVAVQPASATGAAQPQGAVNAASGQTAAPEVVVPGGYVAIYGIYLASAGSPSATTVPLPMNLNDTQLLLGDQPLPLSYASPGQVNGLIPQNLNPNASFPLVVQRGSTRSVPVPVTVAALQPGIYTTDNSGAGQGSVQIAGTAVLAAPVSDGARPVTSGTEYLSIYCTGLGPVVGTKGEAAPADGFPATLPTIYQTTSSVTATIGGVNAPVVFSGLTPTLVALYQVNVQVPAGTPTGDAVPLVLTVTNSDGITAQSNTVTVAVQ